VAIGEQHELLSLLLSLNAVQFDPGVADVTLHEFRRLASKYPSPYVHPVIAVARLRD
jgi:hypothetical protein